MSKAHRLKGWLLRKLRKSVRFVLPIPILLVLLYLLQVYPIIPQLIQASAPFLSPPKEYVNLIIEVAVYVLIQNAIEKRWGGPNLGKGEIAAIGIAQAHEKQRLEEESRSKERLHSAKQNHHKELVDSFFTKLADLRSGYSPQDIFSIDFGVGPSMTSLKSFPHYEEALSHISASEYDLMKSSLGKLSEAVETFNVKAREARSGAKLDSRVKAATPTLSPELRNAPQPSNSSYYHVQNVWIVIGLLARGDQATEHFDDGGHPSMGLSLWMLGWLVAHTGDQDKDTLEKFRSLVIEISESFKDHFEYQVRTYSSLNEPLQELQKAAGAFLYEFKHTKWLHGRCRVEDLLEEEERRHLAEIISPSTDVRSVSSVSSQVWNPTGASFSLIPASSPSLPSWLRCIFSSWHQSPAISINRHLYKTMLQHLLSSIGDWWKSWLSPWRVLGS